MTTFVFSDKFTALERKVYMRAARLACRELKVEHTDVTIEFRLENFRPGNKGAIARLDPKYFVLANNKRNEPHEVVHTICHELIHFEQFMRGDLDEDKSHPIPRVVWKGERYPVIDMSLPSAAEVYYAQPWEKEAFAKHDELFRKVTLSIPSAERAAVADEFESRHNIGDVRDVRDVREMIDMLRAVAAAVAINPLI